MASGRRTETIGQAGAVRSARLESLRAVAALGVLGGHVFGQVHDYDPARTLGTLGDRILLGGGFGVFLFFALSGYLLYWPFARRAFDGGAPIALGRYARNRAVRILPLYYVVLAAVLLGAEQGGTVRQWLAFGLFAQNVTDDRTFLTDVNGVMWSLAVEVHFYVLLPLIAVAVAWAARGSLRGAAAVVAGLGLASLALRWATFYRHGGLEEPLFDYSLPSTFMFFSAGMLVALLNIAWRRRPPGRLRGPLASTETWVLASAALWLALFDDYGRGWLAAPASALLLGACVLPLRPGPLVRALEWRGLAAVGIVSYSLYLWHLPILEWIAARSWEPGGLPAYLAVAVPLCLIAAFASYRAVEQPFLRLRRGWGSTAAAHEEPGVQVAISGVRTSSSPAAAPPAS